MEGELPPERGRAVERHLGACPECRLEFHRLADAWSSVADGEAPASALEDDSKQLARLLEGIQRWESAAARAGLTGHGIKLRLAGHSTFESFLAIFLGRKAASSLACTIGVSLVLLGELGLLMAAYYYVPWPWNSVVWYISVPASCAFALSPAYRLETIFHALIEGRRNSEVQSST